MLGAEQLGGWGGWGLGAEELRGGLVAEGPRGWSCPGFLGAEELRG